ncbi:Claudin [Scophthalmus maximus]|uniref:Claudin n=1 Tax=Scophthalmus maximus TaxID=52904 RepID=A0A2U9B3V4_SCOMX|nr:Claudin [Scophthalmus maximus]
MPSLGLEILGVALAVLGWISAIVSCALPMWRVSAFIGVNIVTAQTTWEGIWMNCVVQSTGQMQCKIHDSMLALSGDLQAARALTIISIVLGILGVLVAIMGAKCTNCVDEETAKARVMIAAGAAFVLASLTQLIPVSWSAHTIIMEFYNPVIPEAQKREIGAALYLGWAAAAFLLIGGAILCSSCPPQPDKKYGPPSKMMYSQTRFSFVIVISNKKKLFLRPEFYRDLRDNLSVEKHTVCWVYDNKNRCFVSFPTLNCPSCSPRQWSRFMSEGGDCTGGIVNTGPQKAKRGGGICREIVPAPKNSKGGLQTVKGLFVARPIGKPAM